MGIFCRDADGGERDALLVLVLFAGADPDVAVVCSLVFLFALSVKDKKSSFNRG